MEPKIAIIMLGYNDEKNLQEAIDSAIRQTYKNFEFIYIDNASTDNSFDYVCKNFPYIKSLRNDRNLGYAGAYQKSLRELFSKDFDSIVLLNSDVVVEETWLDELVKTAYASDEIGAAQPKIFLWDGNKNDLANTFGNEINYLGFGFCGHYKQKDSIDFSYDREITYASGASLLIKKGAYLDAGELDEKFFAYLEDQDLGWRMRLRGYKTMLSVKSKMIHKYKFQKNSRNKWKFYMLERNRLYFIFKNYSTKLIFLILPAFLIMELGIIFHSLLKGYFIDKIKSYYDFVINVKTLYSDRRKIQEGRKVSDGKLFLKFNPQINFEEIDSPLLGVANLFLRGYYKVIKNFI